MHIAILIGGLVGAVLGYTILYFLIKAAVKNGIGEALKDKFLRHDVAATVYKPNEPICPHCSTVLENGICLNCDFRR